MDSEKRKKDVDSGWAWVVLFACFISNVLIAFVHYSSGIFHIALLSEFKAGNTATSTVGALYTSLLYLFGPFAGMFINATSCRTTMMTGGLLLTIGFGFTFIVSSLNGMIVTYGIIAGIGASFCIIPPLVMVGYSFDKYRGFATGLVVAGCGCGMFGGPLVQIFIDEYGLYGAFLLIGGISSQMIVMGALMIPSGAETYHKLDRQSVEKTSQNTCFKLSSIFDVNVLRNKSFMLVLTAAVLWHSCYAIICIHLPNFAVVQGSSNIQASVLMLEIGAGSVFSRLLSGLTAGSSGGLDPFLLTFGVLSITGALTALFPFYSFLYWQQSLFAILFGVYSGGLLAFTVPLCLDCVGLSKLASALGLVYLAGGLGYISGPIITGFMIDKTDSYEYSFIYAGLCLLIASLLVLISAIWRPTAANEMNEKLSFNRSNILYGSTYLAGSVQILCQGKEQTYQWEDINFSDKEEALSLTEITSGDCLTKEI